MRKVISLALVALMLVSVLSVGVAATDLLLATAPLTVAAAPTGTAINSAADFAAMAADGNYYLAADIKIDATYETPFTGTFDGNGHTITVSTTPFANFNGTAKNLTITGSILSEETEAGLARLSSEGCTVENVTNNADVLVTTTLDERNAAGIIAVTQGAEHFFTNCVNTGNIESLYVADPEVTGKPRAAGITAITNAGEYVNCSNTGTIKAIGKSGIAAGITARGGYKSIGANYYLYKNCINNGEIFATDQAAGIAGYCNGSGMAMGLEEFYACVNTATIKGGNQSGGIVGYFWASGSSSYADFEYCVNAGDVYFGKVLAADGSVQSSYGSQMVSYTNSAATTMNACICMGRVLKNTEDNRDSLHVPFIGSSSQNGIDYFLTDIYVTNWEDYDVYSWADSDSNAANRHEKDEAVSAGLINVVTLEQVKSGEVAKMINASTKGADGYLFDENPTTTYPAIIISEEKEPETTKAPETTKKPETTKAPSADTTKAPSADTTKAPTADTTAAPVADTTAAPKAEKSGCGSVLACSIALVAVFGSAVVLSKKH